MATNLLRYNTTALRLAAVTDLTQIGDLVQDLESGGIYMIVAAGTGAASYFRVATANESYLQTIGVPLYSLREIDANGDVSNIAGNGGILASDTTPIMRGDAAESAEVSWATGNVDPVGFQLALPPDFDGSRDCYLDFRVSSGTTDAATLGVETSWDGGTQVADSASDSATKSATAHVISATIDKADIPDAATSLTVAITPPTHGTNAIQLMMVRLRYHSK